jgi:hypothetical protein
MQAPARPACLMEQVTNIVIKRWDGRVVLLELALAMDQMLVQAGEAGKSTRA